MNVIGTAIDQERTDKDGSNRAGCRTAMCKERRNHHIMISKAATTRFNSQNIYVLPVECNYVLCMDVIKKPVIVY
jgi:hypothetical protein